MSWLNTIFIMTAGMLMILTFDERVVVVKSGGTVWDRDVWPLCNLVPPSMDILPFAQSDVMVTWE